MGQGITGNDWKGKRAKEKIPRLITLLRRVHLGLESGKDGRDGEFYVKLKGTITRLYLVQVHR